MEVLLLDSFRKNEDGRDEFVVLIETLYVLSIFFCVSKENKYRGGTSDATTSSALIEPLFTMSVDDFSHSKTAIFGIQK